MLQRLGVGLGDAQTSPWRDWSHGLVAAHREVFGSQVDEAWVRWKYGDGLGVGAGLWQEDALAAFCGGVPRRLWWAGRSTRGLQITDVMVRAAWRQAGRRGGAFARVSTALYAAALGECEPTATSGACVHSAPFEVGYGFPSHRHLKLAVMLGLLRDGGAVTAAAWTAQARPAAQALMRTHRRQTGALELEVLGPEAALEAAQHGWRRMRADLTDHVVGDRGWAVLDWRYRRAPVVPGQGRVVFLGLRPARLAAPVGVAVIRMAPQAVDQADAHRDEPRRAMWLDWIGPAEMLGVAWAQGLDWALSAGATELQGWFTDAPWARLKGTSPAAASEVARLGIPVAGRHDAREVTRHPWWMMAGDTDFL